MTAEKTIRRFDEACAPFHIVDENGRYSLHLPLAFLSGEYEDFCQEAFNRYAKEIGDPVTKRGLHTHGNGFEWEIVFRKAFENDKNLSQLQFDCEPGGFFCYAKNLKTLAKFGYRFRAICDDPERFAELVREGLNEAQIPQWPSAMTKDLQ